MVGGREKMGQVRTLAEFAAESSQFNEPMWVLG